MDVWVVSTFLAIRNNATLNICVQILCGHVFISLGYNKPKSRAAGADSLRNCQTLAQWLHYLTFPPAGHKGSHFSTSSPMVVII